MHAENARGNRVSSRRRTVGARCGLMVGMVGAWLAISPPAEAATRNGQRTELAPQTGQARVPTKARVSARTTATNLKAGAAVRVITPYQYETWNDADGDATYEPPTDTFNDAGVDHLFDWQEAGALGADGKPGKAGVDDNKNGVIDDSGEYLTVGSDDKADPAGDNFNATSNPSGTEGNAAFESVALAGFQGFMGEEIRPMNGVHDELTVRAVAFTNGDEKALLIVTDLLGLLFHYNNPVKRDLETNLGIPFDKIIIAATHTHHGPDPVGIWAGQVYPDYMNFMMQQTYAAAAEAWSRLEPVEVRSATSTPDACYDRATLVRMPDYECFLGDYEYANTEQGAGYDQFMMQTDMRDPWVRRMEIPVMQLVATGGKTVATLVNFDDHPEVLLDENPLASADFPHYVRESVESRFGGVGVYISGTVGGQMGALRGTPIPLYDEDAEPVYQPGMFDAEGNPVPAWASGAEDRTRSLGYAVAAFAIDAIEDAPFTVDPTLRINQSWVDVSIENPVYRLLVNKIKKTLSAEDKAYIIKAPWCSSNGCIRTALHMMTLGDATFLTAPGEFPPEYTVGRATTVTPYSQTDPGYEDYLFPAMPALRTAVRSREFFFVGLANSYFGYAIPKSDTLPFSEADHPNFYEEEYDPYLCFGDAVGNRLFQMLSASSTFSDCVPKP